MFITVYSVLSLDVVKAFDKYSYLSCYIDKEDRDLPNIAFSGSVPYLTSDRCVAECRYQVSLICVTRKGLCHTKRHDYVIRVAKNLEILEKLTSLGGSIFHLGHIKIKKYFLKILFIFATRPSRAPYFHVCSCQHKNFRYFFLSVYQKGKWIHPGR